MKQKVTKGLDEKFCPECGEIIKIQAELCVHCGVRQNGVRQRDNSARINIKMADRSEKTPMIFGILSVVFGGLLSIQFIYFIYDFTPNHNYYYSFSDSVYLFKYNLEFIFEVEKFLFLYFLGYAGMIVSGIGLLNYKEWGRMSGQIIACFSIAVVLFFRIRSLYFSRFSFDFNIYFYIDILIIVFSVLCIIFFNKQKFKDALN